MEMRMVSRKKPPRGSPRNTTVGRDHQPDLLNPAVSLTC